MSEEVISIREFARRVNIGEKTIRDGIRLEKIVKGVKIENGKPKIIFSIAKKEFEKYGLGSKAIYCQSKKEQPVNELKTKKKDIEKTIIVEDSSDSLDNIAGLTGDSSMAQAQRAEKIFKAQLASLEVDEKAGTLVPRDLVRSQLFSAGQASRNVLQSLPDRETDTLISLSNDRNKFYNHFRNAVDAAILEIIQNCKSTI